MSAEAALLGLGKILRSQDDKQRDAVHIAVVPVYVEGVMEPGTKVRLADHTRDIVIAAGDRPYVGVIDPYLQRSVKHGERCWLFLNPGSIRGLRHAWTHPAFDKEQT